ncbi:MAG: AbgT family transporter [Bdellovibrionaceae bacterium]|nr:AbgT family transporter [Pseudobdellovibrionaceae bacterium]
MKRLQNILARVERAGNALPHPAILFLILSGAVIVMSGIVKWFAIEAVHPVTKEAIVATNLLSLGGLHFLLTDLVKNFTGFAPLGSVLVAMLGFAIAEKSGLLATLLRWMVMKAGRKLLVPAILIAGIVSHTAADLGYVLLIPLAALSFHAAGMHPLAGLAVGFAGVSGGFAANFLLGAIDPLLAGLSQEGARILDPNYTVSPVSNYYFFAASSVLIVGVGTLIANRITIPFLGKYGGEAPAPVQALTSPERKGLMAAGVTSLILLAILLLGLVPESGFLRDPASGSVISSPAMKGIVAIIFIFGSLTGLAYGWAAGTMRGSNQVVGALQDAMVTMAPYLVLVFFAAQFIALFAASNVGLIFAVHGSDALKALNIGPVPLMIGFILFTCLLDLFVGSASAKWAMMAPVFVPMFMLLGISPELSQASYRVADSVVNIISPLMPYFPLVLAFANKYDKDAKIGTVLALMLPYSLAFLLSWSIMLFVWMGLNLPLGPGAGLRYEIPAAPAAVAPGE